MTDTSIWVQLGTRLHMVVYRPTRHVWQIWTSTNRRQGDSSTWLGTYIELYRCGKATQHTRRDTDESMIVIRPCPVDECEHCEL